METRKEKVTALIVLLFLLTAILFILPAAPKASGAPLTGTSWCQNKDSIAVIGGSTNTGYLATPQYAYWNRLTAQLNASYGVADDGQAFLSYNWAKNGWSAAQYLPNGADAGATLALIGEKQPNLLIVSVGTNDYLAQRDPALFQNELDDLIDNIYAQPGIITVLLAIQHEVGLKPPVTHPYNQYVTAIFNVAVARNAGLIDHRQRVPPSVYGTPTSTNPAGLYNTVETAPKIHLSDAGHMVYAATYWTLLHTGC